MAENEEVNNIGMPDISVLSKLSFSTSLTGARTKIALTEEIPALEEAPEQITGSAVDIDYEFSRPGKKKAGTIEVPVFYTHTQHKRLKQIENQDLYFWVEYPEKTAPEGEHALIKMFQGRLVTVGDALTDNEWIKDKVTLYRATDVQEMYAFPEQSV